MLDIQELFEGSKVPVKLKQLHKIRRLSMGECVNAMYHTWDDECLSLNDEGAQSNKSSAVARGLFQHVACVRYLLLTVLMYNELAIIGQLNKTFQTVDIDLSLIEPAVHLTLIKIRTVKDTA